MDAQGVANQMSAENRSLQCCDIEHKSSIVRMKLGGVQYCRDIHVYIFSCARHGGERVRGRER